MLRGGQLDRAGLEGTGRAAAGPPAPFGSLSDYRVGAPGPSETFSRLNVAPRGCRLNPCT